VLCYTTHALTSLLLFTTPLHLQEQNELAAVRHIEQHGHDGNDPPLPSGIVYCLTRDETETVCRWGMAWHGMVWYSTFYAVLMLPR
jgi:hypothetical protein